MLAAEEAEDSTPKPSSSADDDTVTQSGNSHKVVKTTKSARSIQQPGLEEKLRLAEEQITLEKAGKRKLFHSLVKVANELRRTRTEAQPVLQQQEYAEKQWYDGGMWRAPQVLPGAAKTRPPKRVLREAISLSDLFFNLVVVTAFTRVGVAISQQGHVDAKSFVYFAMFWSIWSKEAGYSTRFDTTDLSAQMETLVTCFAVLFASLSVQAPLNSDDGTRMMMMAAFVAALHCLLHIRVAATNWRSRTESLLSKHVIHYAIFNIVMTLCESVVWLVGILIYPVDWPYRWCIFVGGIVLGLRVPRAFLANDFHGTLHFRCLYDDVQVELSRCQRCWGRSDRHANYSFLARSIAAACSQRGVLFILLLGFLLQSIVVVASEFFEYQTPSLEHYFFLGAACLMFFCIKLLYVDDADTLAEDHALLVNRMAAFFFNVGQFSLLLSTTVMGSGLNLLTHDYMAASAALPGPAKTLVCGGFSAVLLSTFFIKSMHLKRVPTDPRNQALFVGAYVTQTLVLLAVVGITAAMSFGFTASGFMQYLMQTNIQLLVSLSGAALFIVIMSWLDEGVELTLYQSAADSREYRVHPFGLWWWCLKPEVTDEELEEMGDSSELRSSSTRLSVLSPLLGSSMADLKGIRASMYQSVSVPLLNEGAGRMV